MITSKQRAFLRGMANCMDVSVQIGKNGITKELIDQANETITARELIKFKVLETSPVLPREAAQGLAEEIGAEIVQVIGTKFVLYRENPKKKDRIKL